MSETIFALASAPGRAGVAVYRISGPKAEHTLQVLSRSPTPAPRSAVRTTIYDPEKGDQIDDGIAVWFPAPKSFTGEDVVELHLHGGAAIRKRILELFSSQPSLRLSEPGEFTRRAVLAGKMDLTAAEGMIDLIDAETEAQRRQALRQSQGALGKIYDGWRKILLSSLAHLEAFIDFPDEDLSIEEETIWAPITKLVEDISEHLNDDGRGERLREGLRISILGPPNAGKSSLLNWLVKRDAAIVSERAGTTRDIIEVHLDLAGYPVVFSDTAGIRTAASGIESVGIAKSFDRARTSDLKIIMVATDETEMFSAIEQLIDKDTIFVINKTDLGTANVIDIREKCSSTGAVIFQTSIVERAGLKELLEGIAAAVDKRINTRNSPAISRVRHREALSECIEALNRSRNETLLELRAEDLRVAMCALGRITGAVDIEEILDAVFHDFCIGK